MYWNTVQSHRTMSFQNWLAENFSRRRAVPPANTVVHGQTVIHSVSRLRTHHAGEPMAPLHDPCVADVGGFGQPSSAGSIDTECFIFYGHRPLLVLAKRVARP